MRTLCLIIRHPVIPSAPKCGTQEAMHMVRMHYSEFMRMSCDERDEFLSREILKTNPSLITRLTEPHKRYNSREIIAEMNNVIMNLDTENKILSDTVKWMHDTIWELMHEKRESGQGNGRHPATAEVTGTSGTAGTAGTGNHRRNAWR